MQSGDLNLFMKQRELKMNKNRLSDSLDLLLDTMCNTFGGVVFIAISLALAFFICRDQFYSVDRKEKIAEELKKEQKQATILAEEKELLGKKLSAIKKLSSQFKKSKETSISEEVVRMEQEQKEVKRDIDDATAELNLLKHKKNIAQKENDKKEKDINSKLQSATKENDLMREKQRLDMLIDELTSQLKSIPVTQLHFAHNRRVSSSPYIVLLRNNHVYQLGTDYLVSSPEVSVKRDNNMLILSPINGTLLSSISGNNLFGVLRQFNKHKSFLWILVHPDSFEAFVKFRRELRQAEYPVHWYIDYNAILYLGSNSGYSASY